MSEMSGSLWVERQPASKRLTKGDLSGKIAVGNVGLSQNRNPTSGTENPTLALGEPDPVEAEERRAIQEEDVDGRDVSFEEDLARWGERQSYEGQPPAKTRDTEE